MWTVRNRRDAIASGLEAHSTIEAVNFGCIGVERREIAIRRKRVGTHTPLAFVTAKRGWWVSPIGEFRRTASITRHIFIRDTGVFPNSTPTRIRAYKREGGVSLSHEFRR